MSNGWETEEARAPALGFASSVRSTRSLADLLLGLWRAKWLMLMVFVPILAAGVAFAFTMPQKYTAYSRLLVSLGEEYVYRPRVGGEGAGAIAEPEAVVQAEIEILSSPVVAERVLRRFGLRAIYPDLAEAYEEALPAERDQIFQKGVLLLQRGLATEAAPKRPAITTSFTHDDPQKSAEILNALIGSYLDYRAELFTSGSTDGFAAQRQRFEAQLRDAEIAIQSFLAENDIGDFEAERSASNALYAAIDADISRVDSRARAVDGEIEVLRQQLAETDPEQNLFVEDGSTRVLQELELEREQLLSRYSADSTPVREIDKRIQQVRDYLNAQDGSAGLVRRGPNPLYQDIEQRLTVLESQASSLASEKEALSAQMRRVEARQARLNQLAPRYQELLREQALYESNVRAFLTREVEEATLRELAGIDTDNIKVIEQARAPTQGSSLKMPVAVLSVLMGGFTALVVGLLSALNWTGIATPRSLERQTGLPVLAMARSR